MGDFDEYDFLDKQLEGGGAAANGDAAPAEDKGEKDRSHRSHKSSRSHKEDKERRHKDRSHREKDKDKDKDRDRDRERERRHRSRRADDEDETAERKRRQRSRSRDRHRSSRHRSSERVPPRPHRRPPSPLPFPPRRPVREVTPPEVREQRERERELKELDRDTRTVFAYNLNLKAEEKELFEFFSRAGQVEDVRLITDRNTRRSKGFAYIEMATRESVIQALALGGQTLMGQTVMVKSSEAEKNLAWEAAQVQNQQLQSLRQMEGASGTGPCKLHVRNLHVAMSEADVQEIFQAYGPIDSVVIQKDGMGKSQGHGYVTFSSMADATRAIQQLNGLEIAGAAIKVEIAPDSGMGAAATIAGLEQPTLDDHDEGGGMRLTANARAALMNRLAGTSGGGSSPGIGSGANTTPMGAPAGGAGFVPPAAAPQTAPTAPPINPLSYVQGILGPASPIPTQCLLLKNMFDPAEETEPDWDQEIAEDVKAECGKYGAVVHAHVDKASKGFVYLKFDNGTSAAAAQKALHGRWFAGKQVCAEFQFVAPYNQHFGT